MENNKLISMTEFVLSHPATFDYEWQLSRILNYANFLSQPLKLGQFIPCVDGEPILTPEQYRNTTGATQIGVDSYEEFYNEAKELVLFEGCEAYKPMSESDYYAVEFGNIKLWLTHTNIKVEDLLDCGITLTPTALKIIYGIQK